MTLLTQDPVKVVAPLKHAALVRLLDSKTFQWCECQ
ncbi:hypothetical protein STIAU_1342 [Stigmatella aurantiaca DW4/3-1]|uniref:Uncharacterized protein n=1 Tax=Stigmatella aurantiaca (strain DW4/3-1) TaxID=378806 RepID=Q08YH1_STIAD|nr:hypothetical protein STIAU_1342 [Stigmatella aurantiaca DW4/3-1]